MRAILSLLQFTTILPLGKPQDFDDVRPPLLALPAGRVRDRVPCSRPRPLHRRPHHCRSGCRCPRPPHLRGPPFRRPPRPRRRPDGARGQGEAGPGPHRPAGRGRWRCGRDRHDPAPVCRPAGLRIHCRCDHRRRGLREILHGLTSRRTASRSGRGSTVTSTSLPARTSRSLPGSSASPSSSCRLHR